MMTSLPSRLLIVDDDTQFLSSLNRALKSSFKVLSASNSASAREAFTKEPDIVLLDLRLDETKDSNQDGLKLLQEFLSAYPEIPIVMISAYGDIDMAVECMRLGAADFIQKPCSIKELRQRLKGALGHAQLSRKALQLEERLFQLEPTELIGESPQIQKIKQLIQMVAQDGYATVLIRGKTGTGKELVARAIHKMGWRANDPFVAVPMASLNPNLIESELFGHEAGAFTGATKRRIGFIEKARDGLVFLDEVGDLPSEVQVKLLRFLEERKFSRIGSSTEIQMDVQILAATNRDLEKALEDGGFREDLYFRLKSIQIQLPALIERIDDIPLLMKHFLKLFNEQGRTKITDIAPEAIGALMNYRWPGNVRELKAVLERAIIYANYNTHHRIEENDLPLEIIDSSNSQKDTFFWPKISPEGIDLNHQLAKLELTYIEEALRITGGMKTEAWKLLGLNDRFALHRRVTSLLKKEPELAAEYYMIQSLYVNKPSAADD